MGRKVTSRVPWRLTAKRAILRQELLRNLVERENLVAAFGLRLLDPAAAIAHAIALHVVVEYYGRSSQSRERISGCVTGRSHKHGAIDFLELLVVSRNFALANHKNDSVPIRIRVVRKCSGYKKKTVAIAAPVADVQVPIRNYRQDIRGRHV